MATQRGVGYVYIIKSSGGYCKVGKSHDPEGRLLALQSGNAYTLHLSHKIESDDYGECETFFHDILRHYRLRPNSEWFDLPEYLVDLIQGIPSLNLSEMTDYRRQTICAWLPRDKDPRTVEEQKERQAAEERLRRGGQVRAADPRNAEKKTRAEKKARENEQIRRLMETLGRDQRPRP